MPGVFPLGDLLQMVHYILEQKDKRRINDLPEEMQPKLIAFFTEYEKDYEKRRTFDLRQNIRLCIRDFDGKYPMLKKALRILPKSGKAPLPYEALPLRLKSLSEDVLFDLFSISLEEAEKYDAQFFTQSDFAVSRQKKWKKREKQYREMLAGKHGAEVMHTTKPVDEAIEFLRGYFQIRDERNYSNHAVKDAAQGNESLESFIAAYIEKLRKA